MKTTLELPDDLMRAVKVRAAQSNRRLKDVVAELLEKGMRARPKPARGSAPEHSRIEINPNTGLPIVRSPREAPIVTMNAQDIHALIRQAQEEEDIERLGRGLPGGR